MMGKSGSLRKHNTLSPPRMSDNGSESLRSSSSSLKLYEEYNVSESEMSVGKKRKKVSFSTPVAMESENLEARWKPVVMKRKRTTGQSFKAKYKGNRKYEIDPVELALGQMVKRPSYQEIKEQVHKVKSKEGCLKMIHKQGSWNTIYSGRDHLVARNDINQKTSKVDKQRRPSSSLKLKIVNRKDSAMEEHNENQILSQQKQVVKDKGVGSEIDTLIKKIQKKCGKRMNKLFQKQWEQTQEFLRIWEGERSNLEKDYKLELAIIRSIHGEGTAKTNDKFKLLDGKFAKKRKEQNLLKDVKLNKLEMDQLVARDEERQKEAHWLAKAKACRSGELRAVYGPKSLGLHSEEVGVFSLSSTHIFAAKDVVPLTRNHVDYNSPSKSVQGNNVAPSEKSVMPAEDVDCDIPFGNSSNFSNTHPQIEVGVAFSQRSVLAGAEHLNQLKICTQEIICGLPASRESVPGEFRAVELCKEVPSEVPETAPNEIVDCANPVELSNSTSDKKFDKGYTIGSPVALVNQGDETETVGLPLVGQILEPSEQTKASPLLQQASEYQIPRSSITDVVQYQGAHVVEEHTTSPFEGVVSEHVDTVTIFQSNIELQDRDAPAIESQITSEIATMDIVDVTPEESIVKLQGRNAPILEDQDTSLIEDANSELINTVNPLQDQSVQVVEKENASSFEVVASKHVDTVPVLLSNIGLHDQDVLDTSGIEVATLDIIDIVPHEESSEKLQDQGASVLEDQATLLVEVANSEPVDIVNPVQSNVGAPAIGICEELVSIDVPPSCNQPPSIEVESLSHKLERSSSQTAEIARAVVVPHEAASQLGENRELLSNHVGIGSGSQVNLERNSSLTAEIIDTVVLSHESASQLRENLELQSNHLGIGFNSQVNLERSSSPTVEITDTVVLSHASTSQLGGNRELQSNRFNVGSGCQVTHETSVEVSSSSRNNVSVSQIVASTIELPHQAGLQLRSVGRLNGSSNISFHHQVASLSSPPLHAAPLQHELGKISKEIEQLQKSHGDMKSRLKSDCEKEIQEILAQINNKYDLKLTEAEAEFSFKKNGLHKNQNKVLLNQLLAEAFSSSCMDHWWLPGIQQAAPSSSMQQLQHESLQHLVRPPPLATARQMAPSQPITIPNVLALQQLLLPHFTRRSPIASSPIQTAQQAAALSLGSTSRPPRPPVICAITPTANPCFGGEIRSAAPHLQPRATSSMPTSTSPPNSQHFQLQPSQPLMSPPPPRRPHQPSTFQDRHQLQGGPALLNLSRSAAECPMDLDRAHIRGNRGSSFGSLEQSNMASLCNVQGNETSHVAAVTDAICLSDDD